MAQQYTRGKEKEKTPPRRTNHCEAPPPNKGCLLFSLLCHHFLGHPCAACLLGLHAERSATAPGKSCNVCMVARMKPRLFCSSDGEQSSCEDAQNITVSMRGERTYELSGTTKTGTMPKIMETFDVVGARRATSWNSLDTNALS